MQIDIRVSKKIYRMILDIIKEKRIYRSDLLRKTLKIYKDKYKIYKRDKIGDYSIHLTIKSKGDFNKENYQKYADSISDKEFIECLNEAYRLL